MRCVGDWTEVSDREVLAVAGLFTKMPSEHAVFMDYYCLAADLSSTGTVVNDL